MPAIETLLRHCPSVLVPAAWVQDAAQIRSRTDLLSPLRP
jgi:hypothetical protein